MFLWFMVSFNNEQSIKQMEINLFASKLHYPLFQLLIICTVIFYLTYEKIMAFNEQSRFVLCSH